MSMVIAIDGTALYGRYGGVEYALWNLLGGLDAVNERFRFVVYIPRDGPPPALLRRLSHRFRWVRLPFDGANRLRRVMWQQLQLPARLADDSCGLLHCPTYVSPLMATVPVVLTVYDMIAVSHPQFATALNRLHYGAVISKSIAAAHAVIVPSDRVKQEVARTVPEAAARTRVVPLAVEPAFRSHYDQAARDELQRRYELPDRFVLFVGNFEPKKNLRNVIAAVQHVRNCPPLVIAGGARAWTGYELAHQSPGPSGRDHRAATAQAFSIGYVARRDLPVLYSMCEAFIFPSLAEGFGMPVLEALSAGAPVVTSNAVAIPYLSEVALVADAHDPRSIAREVERVLHDRGLRHKLVASGRALASGYTWKHTAEMTMDVYRSLGVY